MSPEPGAEYEVEGVLNPASGRDADGRLWLLPRLVAAGNFSRIGLAEIVVDGGVPTSVRREGVVLAPDEGWERGVSYGGVEDPRITWIPDLGRHVMTYVANGPLGPHPALATSTDLRTWERHGPIHFDYQADLDTDLNLFPNKDCVFFPEPVTAPDGRPAFVMLHRPMWDLSWIRPNETTYLPAGIDDDRPGIWISYVPVEDVARGMVALTRMQQHRLVATSEYDFEALKIGAGPPPIRVEQGWLLIHHGVTGELEQGWEQQQKVRYAAGAMLLDATDPSVVIARSAEPLLEPETAEETAGTVPNVVFPTAIEEIEGVRYVFYGMADTSIGVARLDLS
ncbi:glycoside hydrolase family 130 protein [Jatrophihabitans sp. YIM 134969]